MGGVKLQWLRRLPDQLSWESKRAASLFMRRCGWSGLVLLAAAVFCIAAWQIKRQQVGELVRVNTELLAARHAQQQLPSQPLAGNNSDGRSRLKDFEDFLLPHEDIPMAVQELLKLAEAEQLAITRGEYRPQVDQQGQFLRYRMTLPVKGDAQAIYRFLQSALRARKALALESVQFKRERIEATVVEARIQWVLLTRLPVDGGSRSARVTVGEL